MPPTKSKHFAAITEPKAIGQLLRDIDAYNGNIIIRAALQIAPYVFVRPGEIRQAEWKEFDFDNAEWHIPAERMKMNQKHIVPLAWQVIVILNDLQQYTSNGRYLFPSLSTKCQSISNATLLQRLARKDEK